MMRLEFLNREEELLRLERAFAKPEGNLVCLYGRRRCGKSRLLREALKGRDAVYYVGDDRTSVLQRRSLARAIADRIPGFEKVDYPDWEVLLERWWQEGPAGAVLALDEFPALAVAAPELPSLLQKHIDAGGEAGLHVALCGSSQRMMLGLVLDRTAPLYGRSEEVLEIAPLAPRFLRVGLGLEDPVRALEAWATWGGIPRYWELAGDFDTHWAAVRHLVFDPMGVLHREPASLLLDDLREITQASSLLAVIGQGRQKVSTMARRLEKPPTSLSRPLNRLIEMGLVRRELPFGVSERKSRQSLYHIADPFLSFWFRFVDPNRSRLGMGQVAEVEREVRAGFRDYLGPVWERLARDSVAHLDIAGRGWRPARRWWGKGLDGRTMEIDVVAESQDGEALLVGEVKLGLPPGAAHRVAKDLQSKINRFPHASGRTVVPCLWYATDPIPYRDIETVHVEQVFGSK